ncbi:MAG: hypothetical protein U5K75_02465 [Ahrensia sp.]|nr:hypothetical protein [Ahrensia sp.]
MSKRNREIYNSESVEIEAIVSQVSERAVQIDDGDNHVWLPLAQVEVRYHERAQARRATVTIPEWLAIDKGLV